MISVLLPVYNGEKYISTAIQSILNQTYKRFELLVIDDGSTDNSASIVKSFTDKRIKYLFKSHSGLGDSLNFGIEKSKYYYLARMDSDDIALPNRFEKQIEFLEQNPKVDILSSWYAEFENEVIYILKTAQKHKVIREKLLLYADICHPSVMMRKDVIQNLGGYKNNNYEKDVFEDYKLWLDIKDKVTFHNLQEVLLLKRYSHNSLSKDNMKVIKKIHYQIQEEYYTDLEKHFDIKLKEKQLYYKGLREYFWGDKKKARKYWVQMKTKIFCYPKILFVFLFTFLSDSLLIRFNEYKVWLRLKMIKMKFTKEGRKLIIDLNVFLNNFTGGK